MSLTSIDLMRLRVQVAEHQLHYATCDWYNNWFGTGKETRLFEAVRNMAYQIGTDNEVLLMGALKEGDNFILNHPPSHGFLRILFSNNNRRVYGEVEENIVRKFVLPKKMVERRTIYSTVCAYRSVLERVSPPSAAFVRECGIGVANVSYPPGLLSLDSIRDISIMIGSPPRRFVPPPETTERFYTLLYKYEDFLKSGGSRLITGGQHVTRGRLITTGTLCALVGIGTYSFLEKTHFIEDLKTDFSNTFQSPELMINAAVGMFEPPWMMIVKWTLAYVEKV